MGKQQLTVKEALEQGYEYCTPCFDEFQLIGIKDCDFLNPHGYEIISKDTAPYQIPYGVIEDAIQDYLDNQEDVENEDGKLNKLASEVDLKDLTDRVNAAFSKTRYYQRAEIILIP